MSKNYYDILGVPKSASDTEIKRAYKKMAMQYHPDRNKGDKKAEDRFKEVNEAYQTLSDESKKKNYDQFGTAEGNPFSNMGGGYRSGGNGGGFSGFEDIFSQFGGSGSRGNQEYEFDLGDILSGMGGGARSRKARYAEDDMYTDPKMKKEAPNLDVVETIEVPFFDFLYDTSIDVRTVYGKHLTLKVKAGTKPGTKFKISGKGRMSERKTGDMYIIVDAKMPHDIPNSLKPMLDAIRSQV